MKRTLLLVVALPLILTGCNKSKRNREEEPDLPDVPVGEKTAGDLTEEEIKEFPVIFVKQLSSYTSYQALTDGHTIANVLGMDVDQTIVVNAIKSDYSYLKNESHSSMKNTVHTAYYHGSDAVFTDTSTYEKKTIAEYLQIYGTYPLDNSIEGYTILNNSVKSVVREKVGDNYKFSMVFDKDASTNNVKIQMKKFGGLDDYPTFKEDINIAITVKNDFTPIQLDLSSHYEAKLFMPSDCKQNYTVTYSHFNETIDIPGLADVKDMFNN